MITAKQLAEVFQYQPETGLFLAIQAPKGKRVRQGALTAGSKSKKGYCYISINWKKYLAHRLAWLSYYGELPEKVIDHIDGNRSNNKINNLRIVDAKTNQENRRFAQKNNSSGFLGVYRSKTAGKFCANIYVNGKARYLGTFANAESAHFAYLNAKRQFHPGCTI